MKRIFAIFAVAALACTLVFATACVTDANVTTEQLLEAMSTPGDVQSVSITVSNGELNTADYRLIYSYYADGSGEPVIDGILKDDPDLPYFAGHLFRHGHSRRPRRLPRRRRRVCDRPSPDQRRPRHGRADHHLRRRGVGE